MPVRKDQAVAAGISTGIDDASKDEETYSKEDPIIVESAKSGRSKCSACCTKIESGKPRVGVFAFKGGRLCYAWIEPTCFLKAAKVEYNTSGRGKCKVTQKEFVKGQFRFAYRVGGSEKSFAYVCMEGIHAILPKVLEAAPDFDISTITGYNDLTPAERAAFVAAASPTSAPTSSIDEDSKRKKSAPTLEEAEPAKKKGRSSRSD
jgi:hypothetical protein